MNVGKSPVTRRDHSRNKLSDDSSRAGTAQPGHRETYQDRMGGNRENLLGLATEGNGTYELVIVDGYHTELAAALDFGMPSPFGETAAR